MVDLTALDEAEKAIVLAGLAMLHAGSIAHEANRPVLGATLGLAALPFGIALGFKRGRGVAAFCVSFAIATNAIAWRRANERRAREANTVDADARDVGSGEHPRERLMWAR